MSVLCCYEFLFEGILHVRLTRLTAKRLRIVKFSDIPICKRLS